MLHNDELNINLLLLLVAVATFAPGLGLFPSPWTWIHWRGQSLRPWTDEELPGILCSLSPARSDSLSHYRCPPPTSVSSSSSSHCRCDVDLRLPAWKQRNYESQGRLWGLDSLTFSLCWEHQSEDFGRIQAPKPKHYNGKIDQIYTEIMSAVYLQ